MFSRRIGVGAAPKHAASKILQPGPVTGRVDTTGLDSPCLHSAAPPSTEATLHKESMEGRESARMLDRKGVECNEV